MAPSRFGWMTGSEVIGNLLHNNAIVARFILDTNIALWATRTGSAPSILLALLEPHLKVLLTKCFFPQNRVKYVGHIVSSRGIEANPERIAKVKEWPTPANAVSKTIPRFRWLLLNVRQRLLQDCQTAL